MSRRRRKKVVDIEAQAVARREVSDCHSRHTFRQKYFMKLDDERMQLTERRTTTTKGRPDNGSSVDRAEVPGPPSTTATLGNRYLHDARPASNQIRRRWRAPTNAESIVH